MRNFGCNSNQENGWNSTPQGSYVEYITTIERMPSEVYYHTPPNNRVLEQEVEEALHFHDDHVNHHHYHQNNNNNKHQHHHAPEVHKKVHFVEQERISRPDGEGFKLKDINMEADGFIKQKHKSFLHF